MRTTSFLAGVLTFFRYIVLGYLHARDGHGATGGCRDRAEQPRSRLRGQTTSSTGRRIMSLMGETRRARERLGLDFETVL